MLMDMFYSATEGMVKHRRRFHFHEVIFLFCFHDVVKFLMITCVLG